VVTNVKLAVEINTIVIFVLLKENKLQVPVLVLKDNTKLTKSVMIVVIDVEPVLTLTMNVTSVLMKLEVQPNNAHVNQVTSTMDSKLNAHHVPFNV
jgi:PKD repeat protein